MAFSTPPKENYLNALNNKPIEYTPITALDAASVGGFVPWERGEDGAGVDAFGVRWVSPPTAARGALPAPDEFMLEDVTEWKKVVKYNDLSDYDWEKIAEAELAPYDRNERVIDIASLNSIYERLACLMGFEGALYAMATEPEATYELLEYLTDWKIELLQYYNKYYQPDIFTHHDDVATERSLFMSPEMYRTLIKPLHTKLAKAVTELGIIPIQHTCGKSDAIVQDMIDEGHKGWSAVQATNDIEDIIQNHGHEFTILGGYNSNGAPGQIATVTEEEVRAEVRRCFATYAKYGKGYIFGGSIVVPGTANTGLEPHPMNLALIDEAAKIRAEQEAAA